MGVPVLLEEVVDAIEMQSDSMRHYLDRQTGNIELVTDDDTAGDEDMMALAEAIEGDTEGRFVPLPDSFDVHEWEMMENFARHLRDPDAAEALLGAIRGRGAFRRFKDQVERLGMMEQWYTFRDARYREIAIEWCQENDIAYREGRSG